MGKKEEWELGDAQKRREKAFRDWFEDRLEQGADRRRHEE